MWLPGMVCSEKTLLGPWAFGENPYPLDINDSRGFALVGLQEMYVEVNWFQHKDATVHIVQNFESFARTLFRTPYLLVERFSMFSAM